MGQVPELKWIGLD